MNIPAVIAEIQGKLGLENDGLAGPRTWAAIYTAVLGKGWQEPESPVVSGEVDARSERAVLTLLPNVQPYARALVVAAAKQGIRIVITSGSRTYAEQDALFEQGRTKPGKIVTKARGGQSNHNFGIAFDVTIFQGSEPVWESPLYKVVGSIGRSLGLSWGGDWTSISDEPHFELKPSWAKTLGESAMLTQLRARKDRGEAFFA